MTFKDFRKLTAKMLKLNPEMEEADMWAVNSEGNRFPISYIGFDKRHKPSRMKLEE